MRPATCRPIVQFNASASTFLLQPQPPSCPARSVPCILSLLPAPLLSGSLPSYWGDSWLLCWDFFGLSASNFQRLFPRASVGYWILDFYSLFFSSCWFISNIFFFFLVIVVWVGVWPSRPGTTKLESLQPLVFSAPHIRWGGGFIRVWPSRPGTVKLESLQPLAFSAL